MNISCLASETVSDVQCSVCGRRFLVLTEPEAGTSRGALCRNTRKALAEQHRDNPLASAHPVGAFDIPGWDGEPEQTRVPWATGRVPLHRFNC